MLQTNQNYVDNIANHLETALANALHMQQHVHQTEGESDLYRKVAYYLIPNLQHWIAGVQAGNVKDLRDVFARRDAGLPDVSEAPGLKTDGAEVVTHKTKKKKKK